MEFDSALEREGFDEVTANPEPAITRIEIERVSTGQRGPLFKVTLAGEIIVASSRNPEFDACRVLLARGVTGTLVSRHAGQSYDAMRVKIEIGAALTTSEDVSGRLRFAKWQPYSGHDAE